MDRDREIKMRIEKERMDKDIDQGGDTMKCREWIETKRARILKEKREKDTTRTITKNKEMRRTKKEGTYEVL